MFIGCIYFVTYQIIENNCFGMTSDFLNSKWISTIIFIHASTLNEQWLFHVICHADNSIFVWQFNPLTKFYNNQIPYSFIHTTHDSFLRENITVCWTSNAGDVNYIVNTHYLHGYFSDTVWLFLLWMDLIFRQERYVVENLLRSNHQPRVLTDQLFWKIPMIILPKNSKISISWKSWL